MKFPNNVFALCCSAMTLVACSMDPAQGQDPPVDTLMDPVSDCTLLTEPPTDQPTEVLLLNANLLDIRRGQIAEEGWVHVEGSRIVASSLDSAEQPLDIPRLDLCGAVLAPGLADMHVHLNPDDLADYLDAGVTTVRNMWGWTGLPAMMTAVHSGQREGPWIYAMSPGIDGPPVHWPQTQLVHTPEEGRAAVQRQVADGWTTLKLYQDLSRATYLAVVDEAKQHGMGYGGHVSRKVGLELALTSGHQFIEHLSGYEVELNPMQMGGAFAWRDIQAARIPELIQMTVDSGVWNSPTLAIFTMIARGDPVIKANRNAFVKALHDAGAGLLIGTDAGIGRTAPGSSIHDEIAEFLDAGISVTEVFQIATVEAAGFIGEEGQFGEITPGARADLVLLSGNPLEDPEVFRRPVMVWSQGKRVR